MAKTDIIRNNQILMPRKLPLAKGRSQEEFSLHNNHVIQVSIKTINRLQREKRLNYFYEKAKQLGMRIRKADKEDRRKGHALMVYPSPLMRGEIGYKALIELGCEFADLSQMEMNGIGVSDIVY